MKEKIVGRKREMEKQVKKEKVNEKKDKIK